MEEDDLICEQVANVLEEVDEWDVEYLENEKNNNKSPKYWSSVFEDPDQKCNDNISWQSSKGKGRGKNSRTFKRAQATKLEAGIPHNRSRSRSISPVSSFEQGEEVKPSKNSEDLLLSRKVSLSGMAKGSDTVVDIDIDDDDPDVIDLTIAADLSESETLASDLEAMFPDTPKEYIRERCRDLVGNPVAIERFMDEILLDPSPKRRRKVATHERHKDNEDASMKKFPSSSDIDIAGPSSSKDGVKPKPDHPLEHFMDDVLLDPGPCDYWNQNVQKISERKRKTKEGAGVSPKIEGASNLKDGVKPKPYHPEVNANWVLEKHSLLIATFPDICPYYLLTVVQKVKVDSQTSFGDIDLLFASKFGDMKALTEEEKRRLPSSSAVTKVKMKPSDLRSINFNDPNENMYRFAAGHFYETQRPGSIESMDIVSNPKLKAAFEEKQREFERRKIPHLPIFAYHGTNASSIDSILQTNFDITKAKRQAHGPGNYFSEYPATALTYSNDQRTLIFCQILPGRQYKGPLMTWPDYDSKLVSPDQNDVSQMVIIGNKDQILPCAVIHLSQTVPQLMWATISGAPNVQGAYQPPAPVVHHIPVARVKRKKQSRI